MKDCNKKGNNYVPAIPKSLESCTKCSDNEIDKKIEKLLQSNQPIGISYCSTVLRNGNYQGIYNSRNDDLKWYTRSERVKLEKDKQAKSIDTKEKKRCGRHASVITGSRKYKGQCQYLLKNSWGDTSYKDHPNCICQRNNGSYFDCKRGDGNHNRVGCWVDSKKLTPNLFKLTHF